jgi:hypothetical protein
MDDVEAADEPSGDEQQWFSSRIINLTRGANKGTLSTSNFLRALALDKPAIDALRAGC